LILAGVRAGLAGFRCTGQTGDLRADVPRPAADTGRGEPAGRCWPFPGAAQVGAPDRSSGERRCRRPGWPPGAGACVAWRWRPRRLEAARARPRARTLVRAGAPIPVSRPAIGHPTEAHLHSHAPAGSTVAMDVAHPQQDWNSYRNVVRLALQLWQFFFPGPYPVWAGPARCDGSAGPTGCQQPGKASAGRLTGPRWGRDADMSHAPVFGRYVNPSGEFVRDQCYISTRITADGRDGFQVEPDRYRLVVSRACPWASRAVIVRRLLGLGPCCPWDRQPGARRAQLDV
jgi:hypothetical protein